jgi:sulfur-oxidizing protein SoxY
MRNVESSVEQGNPRCLKKAVFTGERRRSIMSVRTVSSCLALAWTFLSLQALAADAAPQASEIWQKVRTSLFESRPIRTDADAIIQLEAPTRAEDASVVPISIKTRLIQSPERYIDKVYLVIDKNPSPIAAVFQFTPDSGRADMETRVRIEEYTYVRAIAEMNNGDLYMSARYVKASGGCSAPAGKDQAAALSNLGRMKFRVEDPITLGRPTLAQLMISHPNNSGLAMDQSTRLYAPPYFVRKVTVTYSGRPVLTAEVDFSISENPNFRFYFVPGGEGELKAEVIDSRDLTYDNQLMVRPRKLAGG